MIDSFAKKAYLLLPAALTSFLAIGLFKLSKIKQPLNPIIIDTHVNMFGLNSTRLQTILYIFCLAIFSCSTVFVLVAKKYRIEFKNARICWGDGFGLGIILVLLGVMFLSTDGSIKLIFMLALVSSIPLLLYNINYLSTPRTAKFCTILVFATYLLFVYILPLIHEYPLDDSDSLFSHQLHHASTVLPGIDIAKNQRLETPGGHYYGFVMPLGILAAKLFAGLSLTDPSITIKTVQFFNILASLLVGIIIWNILKKPWKYLSLLSILLLPSLNLVNASVSTPNHSGIRYITLLIALLLLVIIDKKYQPRNLFILAAMGGSLMALNLELGICINAGFITYSILISLPYKQAIGKVAFLYLSIASVGFIVTSITAITGLASIKGFESFSYFVGMFGASGYGGAVSKPSFLAMGVFFIATMILSAEALRNRSGDDNNSPNHNAINCSISVMMLSWLPYYINRMGEWNLWIMSLFLLLLALNYSETWLNIALPAKLRIRSSAILILPLLMALAYDAVRVSAGSTKGYIRSLHANRCKFVNNVVRPYCPSKDIIDRVGPLNSYLMMPETMRNEYLLLSPFHDVDARTLGFNIHYPWHSTTGAITLEELRDQSKWINANGPKYIALAAAKPSDSYGIREAIRHLRLIADGANSYSVLRSTNGWIIYQRT